VDGPTYRLVAHDNALDGGTFKPQIRPLRWTTDGWPLVGAPSVNP